MLSSTASVLLIQIFLLILYIYIRVMLPPMLLLLMMLLLLLLLCELFRNVPNVVVIEIGYICFYTVDWC